VGAIYTLTDRFARTVGGMRKLVRWKSSQRVRPIDDEDQTDNRALIDRPRAHPVESTDLKALSNRPNRGQKTRGSRRQMPQITHKQRVYQPSMFRPCVLAPRGLCLWPALALALRGAQLWLPPTILLHRNAL